MVLPVFFMVKFIQNVLTPLFSQFVEWINLGSRKSWWVASCKSIFPEWSDRNPHWLPISLEKLPGTEENTSVSFCAKTGCEIPSSNQKIRIKKTNFLKVSGIRMIRMNNELAYRSWSIAAASRRSLSVMMFPASWVDRRIST